MSLLSDLFKNVVKTAFLREQIIVAGGTMQTWCGSTTMHLRGSILLPQMWGESLPNIV